MDAEIKRWTAQRKMALASHAIGDWIRFYNHRRPLCEVNAQVPTLLVMHDPSDVEALAYPVVRIEGGSGWWGRR